MDRVRAAVSSAIRDEDPGVDPLVRVCRACVALLPVDGASTSVISGTRHPETLFASDEVMARVESVQFTLGEGPCFEAFTTRRPVLVPDLRRALAERWPTFASEIADQPIGAIFASPIQSGAITIGAMDMYRRDAGLLTTAELATALRWWTWPRWPWSARPPTDRAQTSTSTGSHRYRAGPRCTRPPAC